MLDSYRFTLTAKETTMVRSFTLLWTALFICSAALRAQVETVRPFRVNEGAAMESRLALRSYVGEFVLLKLDRTAAEGIVASRSERINLELPETAESVRAMELRRFDILKPGALTVAGTETGDAPVSVRDRFVSYLGDFGSNERRLWSLSLGTHGVVGMFEVDDETYVLGSLKGMDGFTAEDYILYPVSALKSQPSYECGSEAFEVTDRIEQMMASSRGRNFEPLTSELLDVTMAIESDYQTFVFFGGSVEDATSYLLALMSTVSALYLRDINCRLSVGYTRVWSVEADPYSDSPPSSSTLLNEFRNYWNANMQGVPRTTAHYISTRNQGLGGVAWLDVLCESLTGGYGYAFSDIQNGALIGLPTYSWQVMVVAHETGHNFGSPHTHSCSWNPPIDTCYVGSETSGCYFGPCQVGQTCIPRLGYIMSYCHLTSGGIQLYFGQQCSDLMRSYAEIASCVGNVASGLVVGYPNGGESFNTPSSLGGTSSTIITWGSDFIGTVRLEYSPDDGQQWFYIDSVASDSREYTWQIPYVQTTEEARVRISNQADTTQRDTSDGPFRIKAVLWNPTCAFPPNRAAIGVDQGDYNPVQFRWNIAGPIPDITYRFYLRRKSSATPSTYWEMGNDTSLTVHQHDLDSILTSWGAWVGDSVVCYWYGVAYNGSDTMRASPRFEATFKRGGVVSVGEEKELPRRFALVGNYPNPFNPATTIRYDLAATGHVLLRVYNLLGQEVRTVVDETQTAGRKSAVWDGRDASGASVASGIYLYRMEFSGDGKKFQSTRKMIFMK
jgi:hypothetical protein